MRPWKTLFLVAPDCHAAAGHYTALWRRHFYEGVAAAGIRTVVPRDLDFTFAYDPTPPDPSTSERMNSRLLAQILAARDTHRIEAVISYARDREIVPAVVSACQEAGLPWINFYCDSVGQFDLVRGLATAATLNWFPESAALPHYLSTGRPALCRPYALNPAALPHLPSAPTGRAGFLGVPSANRVTVMSLLRLLGCPLEIHGFGWDRPGQMAFGGKADPWPVKLRRLMRESGRLERLWRRVGWRLLRPHVRGPLDDEAMQAFLGKCQMVLGLNDARTPSGALISYPKFRDFEMPGYGCCYLTQANDDIHAALTPDHEVLTFRNVWEARSKLRFYLKRPEACRRIGENARARILREHTWTNRLHELQRALPA